MSRDAQYRFLGWASAREHALLRTAVLLTADLARAPELVEEVLARLRLRWAEVADDDPEMAVHADMVRAVVPRWNRDEPPSGSRVPLLQPDEDRPLLTLTALGMLTARERAVLVLRCHDGWSVPQVAEVLGVGGAGVTTLHLAGERRLRAVAPTLARHLDQSGRSVGQLLAEAVEELPGPGLAAAALDRAENLRRRRITRVAGAALVVAVVATLGVGIGLSTAGSGADEDTMRFARLDPASDPARWTDYQVWLGAQVDDETSLPVVPSRFPRHVRLGPPYDSTPIDTAVAAFGRIRRESLSQIVLLDSVGGVHRVDLPTLRLERDNGQSRVEPFGESALAPGGDRLAIGEHGAIWVYDISSTRWARYPVPTWARTDRPEWLGRSLIDLGDGYVVALPAGGMLPMHQTAQVAPRGFDAYGPIRTSSGWSAQSAASDEMIAVDAGVTNPDVVIARQLQGESSMLVLPADSRHEVPTWAGGCCPVAGWLDDTTVVVASTSSAGVRLIAWDVTSGALGLVSRIRVSGGGSVVGSYPDLGQARRTWQGPPDQNPRWLLRIGDLAGSQSP